MRIRPISTATLALGLALSATVGNSSAAVILGFGEVGHSTTGPWSVNNTGYGRAEHYESAPNSGATSTWDFAGLADGEYYVAATWTPAGNRTTAAAYAISDGGGTVTVDQQGEVFPFNADGFGWNRLTDTPVSVTDGTLSVTLSDSIDGLFIMADAIRISEDPFGDPNIFIIDNNDLMGFSTTGGWNYLNQHFDAFAQDIQYQDDPAGDHTVSWNFADLPAGSYRVSASWQVHANRTNNADYAISDGGGTVNVNQQVFTADLVDGVNWQDLVPAMRITDGDLSVTLSDNDTAGFLIADAIRVELLPEELVWDEQGDGTWGDIDTVTGDSRWFNEDLDRVPYVPGAVHRVLVRTDTVSMAEDRRASALTVANAGGVAVADNVTLTVDKRVDVAPGATLTLGNGAALSAGLGGSIDSLTAAADAVLDVGKDLPVTSFSAAPGAFTKQGEGSLVLENTMGAGVSAAGATFRIEAGTVASTGADPLGGATAIELAGGTLALSSPQAAAYFSFDDDADPGHDDTGNGHNGTLLAAAADLPPSWTASGKAGGALEFGSETSQMLLNPVVDIDAAWTVASWYKGLAPDGLYRTLTRGVPVDHQLLVNPDGDLGVYDNANGGFRDTGFDMAGLDNAVWHHLAAVGSGDSTEIYVDGVLVGTSDRKSTSSIHSIGNLAGGNQRFADVLDEVLVYNRALDPSEIILLRDVGAGAVVGDPLEMATTSVTVSADSALDVSSGSVVPFGPLTMEAGILTTSGVGAGVRFAGTTIDPQATAVGFDPQIATDYGVIDAGSAAVTIAKAGPGTWLLETAPLNLENAAWQVAGGTLKMTGLAPLGGRPVTVTGGALQVLEPGPAAELQVTLSGGTLSLHTGEPVAGPAAYFSFDNPVNLGSDDSGNGHVGNVIGATWTGAGKIGGALATPAAADRVLAAPVVDVGDAWTISSWYKGLAPPGFRTLTRGSATDHHLLVIPDGSLGAWLNGMDPSFQDSGFDMGGVDNDVWHHFVAVGSNGSTAYYLDRTLVGTAANQSVADVQAIGNAGGGGQRFADVIDEMLIYDRVLDMAEIGALYDAGVAGGYAAALDMTGTDLTVTADSMINAVAPSAAFGSLTLQGGVITTAGAAGGMSFTATTIAPGATAVGFNPQVDTDFGVITADGVTPLTISKLGAGRLIMDRENVGLDSATFDVQQGELLVSMPTASLNPLGLAAISLNGGGLMLASGGGGVTYDNALTVTDQGGEIVAGSGGVGAAGPLTVTLGNASREIALDNGTLAMRSTDDYALNVAGVLSGSGGVSVTGGDVTLASGGDVGSLRVSGGTANMGAAISAGNLNVSGGILNMGADLTVDTMRVSGGTVNTGASRLIVSQSLKIDDTSFLIDGENTFQVSGTDLRSEDVARQVALAGGTLSLSKAALPPGAMGTWSFDEGSGDTAADSSTEGGNNPANLVGPTWVTDDPVRGTVIEFDGIDDYVEMPSFDLTTDTITFAAWLNGHKTGNWSGIMTSRVANGGTSDAFMGFGTRDNLHYVWNTNSPETYNWDGGPDIPVDQWAFVAVAIDPEKITAYVWSDGVLEVGVNEIPHIAETVDALEIGRDYPSTTRYYQGLIDDVYMYDRALSAEEVGDLLAALGGPLELPNTDLTVTADSTIELDTREDATLGDLTLRADVTLTVDGPAINVRNLSTAANAAILGTAVLVRGTVAIGDGVAGDARLMIEGELEFDDDAEYLCELNASGNDLIEVTEDVYPGGSLILSAVTGLGQWGDQTRTILRVSGDGEGEVIGGFAVEPALGDHLGHGVFHQGLTYSDDTALDVDVFQAAPGDTDGNREINNSDLQQILGANSFGNGTGFDWPQGDFDGDGDVDNGDLQLILGTGLFGTGSYAAIAADGSGGGLTAVPEPGTLVLLAMGMLVLLAGPRVRRRCPAR